MRAQDIIQKYISFFEKRGHTQIANSSLVPENDPTTLFTSSGMQPLVPYLLGEKHPSGKRLVNVQNSFRAQDIDEIGDNRHTTFFRMLGNWSLGDYFKTDQLKWIFDFLVDPKEGLGLDPHKLYVTVFEGEGTIPKDTESIEIWKTLFQNVGIDARENERIFTYGVEKNWWSRSGIPDNMPVGEPGGPDSEVFYDFGEELKIHENSSLSKEACHVNCDCGRYLEIGNSVFMQYKKTKDGFEELPQKNVDFGGGLERLLAAVDNNPDVFYTDCYLPIIRELEVINNRYKYGAHPNTDRYFRIIADHLNASVMLIDDGVIPSNKERGYVVRRLLRRAIWYGRNYLFIPEPFVVRIFNSIRVEFKDIYSGLLVKKNIISNILEEEENKFLKMIDKGTSQLPKLAEQFAREKLAKSQNVNLILNELDNRATGQLLFYMYETYGFPPDLVKDILEEQGWNFSVNLIEEFQKAKGKHQEVSRTGAEKKFAGGLADHSELTVKGHTATHLLHQALRDVLGSKVHQSGSNITPERVRFDYNYDKKMTPEELQKVEEIVNEKIRENLFVHFEFMPLAQAKKLGAIGLFDEKYGDTVKIYFIGGSAPHLDPLPQGEEDQGKPYSIEFCGGPHVEFTGSLKRFKIVKEEGLGKGYRRIYAQVE